MIEVKKLITCFPLQVRNLGIKFAVAGVDMFEQLFLVSLQFLLELLECRSTVASGILADGTFLDVPGQVQEVLLARLGAIVKCFAKTLPLVG